MQGSGPPLNTGHSNRPWITLRLQRLVLLHILDELAGDFVDAQALTLGWRNAVKDHAIAHAVDCNSGFGSDGHGLPLLFGHHELPVFRICNFHRTKVSCTHALTRENALE